MSPSSLIADVTLLCKNIIDSLQIETFQTFPKNDACFFVCDFQALRLSSSAKRDYTLGEIVNLMAVDVQRMMDVVLYVNLAWTAPIQLSIAMYLLWQRLGPAVLAGVAVLILVNVMTFAMVGYAKKLQVLN